MIAPSAITATYLLATIYSGTFLSARPFGFQLMLTVALYPCIAWLLVRAQQFLRDADLVKFAHHVPDADAVGVSIELAQQFLEETRPSHA